MRVAAHEWTPRRIRDLRRQFGDTQADFAVRLEALRGAPVQRDRVVRWEGGTARPSPEYVALLRELDRVAWGVNEARQPAAPEAEAGWVQRRIPIRAEERQAMAAIDPNWLAVIDRALVEDGTGDVTSEATVPEGTWGRGVLLAKGSGVLSGAAVAEAVFERVDPAIAYTPRLDDGDRLVPGATIALVEGPARSLLKAERIALNLMQRLSGVATTTAKFVEAVEGTGARVVDTRKTTPGLRVLEKAAVRHGGGHNHRFGLSDGVLIKDNHLAAVGGPDRVTQAVRRAREYAPHSLRIEVEVTTLDELREALEAGADVVLLDNMSTAQMREAVEITQGRAVLEASGGVTLRRVREIAETGVDIISAGALTHSAPSIDISLDFETEPVRAGGTGTREPDSE